MLRQLAFIIVLVRIRHSVYFYTGLILIVRSVLATKNLIRVTQAKPYGPLNIQIV